MRIAILSRNFSVRGGGAERYSIALAGQWAQRHEVHVFAQQGDADVPGVQMHRISMPLERPRWINQLYFAWATWRATRKGFDLVHSHENTWHGNLQTVHVLPVRYTLFHGRTGLARVLRWLKVCTSPRLLAYLWLESARYSNAQGKRVVVTSSLLREAMLVAYPRAAHMVAKVPPGVDTVPGRASEQDRHLARQQLGLDPHRQWLLYVGNDFHKKGLPALLAAMRLLPQEVCLAVVGQGDALSQMQALATPLGPRVQFLQALTDVAVAYRACDLLVHPTLEDTYAMVVLEAMAHGLPTVVSGPQYCGIAAELAQGEDAMLLRNPRDATAIANAVAAVMGDGALQRKLSDAGVQFASERLWKAASEAYERLWRPPKQRWLVLAHAFNMDGRAASQTITDKIPHLRKAGIELVVLSGVSGALDQNVEHYQLWPALPAGIKFELRHVLHRHLGYGGAYRLASVLTSVFLLPGMFVEKLLRPVESSWSWWISAHCKGRALLRQQHFDLIYSTGGAFAAHVAGRALQKASGVRWLAEVHDPMVTPGHEPDTAQEKMQAKVEGVICRHADVAVWFTDAALESARRRHPELEGRGVSILPGVDCPFDVLPARTPTSTFRMGHFGSLSTTRNLSAVFKAIEWAQLHLGPDEKALELHLYGGPLDPVSRRALQASTIRSQVFHHGRIESDPESGLSGREQIVRLMRQMDALILLHGSESICQEYVPSKLYEYLWMRRPILALVHENPQLHSILEDQGHRVIRTDVATDGDELYMAIGRDILYLQAAWQRRQLSDQDGDSPYSTLRAVTSLLAATQEEK